MKLHHALVSAFAILGVCQLAVGQVNTPPPGSQVSMCVTTAIGTCGSFCEPFQCTPNYTLVASRETMVIDIGGAPGSLYVLFGGTAVEGCQPVAGIDGMLAAWAPLTVLNIGMLTDVASEPCALAKDVVKYPVPVVCPGADVRFQLLGLNSYLRTSPTLSFSRATEVRCR